METEHNWTKPEPFDYQDGVLHRYIEGGRYGIIGTPGRSDWCVVYATDGVSVSETDPLCNDLTEDAAQREAETLEEEPEDDDQAE